MRCLSALEKNRRPRGTTSIPPSDGEIFAADAGASIVALRYALIVIGFLVAH
jgi:hypothetical protein